MLECAPNKVSADAFVFRRVTACIVSAFVEWPLFDLGSGAFYKVYRVILAVSVLIVAKRNRLDFERGPQ